MMKTLIAALPQAHARRTLTKTICHETREGIPSLGTQDQSRAETEGMFEKFVRRRFARMEPV